MYDLDRHPGHFVAGRIGLVRSVRLPTPSEQARFTFTFLFLISVRRRTAKVTSSVEMSCTCASGLAEISNSYLILLINSDFRIASMYIENNADCKRFKEEDKNTSNGVSSAPAAAPSGLHPWSASFAVVEVCRIPLLLSKKEGCRGRVAENTDEPNTGLPLLKARPISLEEEATRPPGHEESAADNGDDVDCNNIGAPSRSSSILTTTRRGRSRSMLEGCEMKVIHHLENEMEQILAEGGNYEMPASRSSEEEVHQHPDTNNIHIIMNRTLTGVSTTTDDDDGFIFFDEDNDDAHNKPHHYNASSVHEQNIVEQKRVALQTAPFGRRFSESDAGVEIYSQPKKVGTLLEPICEESERKKKRNRKGILGKIGMKRSVLLGLFHRRPSSSKKSLDQSQHNLPHYDLNNLEQNVLSISSMRKLDSFDANLTASTSSSRDISNSLDSHEEGLTMDTSRCTDDIGPSSLLETPNTMIAIKNCSRSNHVEQRNDGSVSPSFTSSSPTQEEVPPSCVESASSSGSPQVSPLGEYRHDGSKKPAASILKKATSMIDLGGQNNLKISTSSSMKPNISFSTLEIREYNVTIGDNPGGYRGPPISLDWNYCPDSTVKMCIETYEEHRGQRRAKHEMYMPASIRMWTLTENLGYSMIEIMDASKAAESIRKDRAKSIKNKKIYDLQYKVGKLLGRDLI